MSLLAPWMLGAGVFAALGVVALHLLSTRRPPEAPLPTARFVPEADARAVSRSSRPTDLLLMLLRVLAVLLLAAGFAQPVLNAPGPRVRSVIAVEWTTALEDTAAVRALVAERLGEGDALVLFDTAARVAQEPTWVAPTVRQARLSPMLVAARDAAARIGRGADSLRLVVISGFGAESFDAATAALRASWPGRIELLPVAAAVDAVGGPRPELRTPLADDPLAPALAALWARAAAETGQGDAGSALPLPRAAQDLRIVRDTLRAEDLTWLSGGSRVLVHWPLLSVAAPSGGNSVAPDGVVLSDAATPQSVPTLVAPLARLAVDSGRVLARWRDGAPAVTERAPADADAACLRSVGIGLPLAGDVTLRPAFQSLAAGLLAPCGGVRAPAPDDSLLRAFAGAGTLATAEALRAESASVSPAAPWLLLAALLILVCEQWLRARPRQQEEAA